jgi:hypothetical protein
MVDYYYPVQCKKCKRFLGYSDDDFENPTEYSVDIWCKYCVEIKIKDDNK